MSLSFVAASTQYATIDSPPFTGYPFTVFTLFKPTSLADNTLWWCGDKDASNNYWRCFLNATTGTISFGARNTTLNNATTSNGATAGAWCRAVCVGISATSRRVMLNGGTVATNATSTTPNATDRWAIAMSRDSTPTEPFDGLICETVAWNVALTDGMAAALCRGVHPYRFRTAAITGHWPMWNNGNDLTRNRRHMTLVASPTVAVHGPIAPGFGLDTSVAA